MGIVPSCLRTILSSVWFEGNEISVACACTFKVVRRTTSRLPVLATIVADECTRAPLALPIQTAVAPPQGPGPTEAEAASALCRRTDSDSDLSDPSDGPHDSRGPKVACPKNLGGT